LQGSIGRKGRAEEGEVDRVRPDGRGREGVEQLLLRILIQTNARYREEEINTCQQQGTAQVQEIAKAYAFS